MLFSARSATSAVKYKNETAEETEEVEEKSALLLQVFSFIINVN